MHSSTARRIWVSCRATLEYIFSCEFPHVFKIRLRFIGPIKVESVFSVYSKKKKELEASVVNALKRQTMHVYNRMCVLFGLVRNAHFIIETIWKNNLIGMCVRRMKKIDRKKTLIIHFVISHISY